MLLQLHVKSYALIDDLELYFSPGFNVLTGETGAGKSIIIGAIGLILGERAVTGQIRDGEDSALIEAIFSPEERLSDEVTKILHRAGIEISDPLIVSREIFREGRSLGRINGRVVPVSLLKELGGCLIDLHGQHQHQSLLLPDQHLKLLDEFGGEKVLLHRDEVLRIFNNRQDRLRKLSELGMDIREQEMERLKDLLGYQIREIEEASLVPGEEEELAQREKILANAEKLLGAASGAYEELSAGVEGGLARPVRDRLGDILQELRGAARMDPSLNAVAEMLETAQIHLEEASSELREYQDKITFDPRELQIVHERLERINNLKKKYGSSLAEIIEFAETKRAELRDIEKSAELARDLQKEIKELDKELHDACKSLTGLRRDVSHSLEILLHNELSQLALSKARVKVTLTPRETPAPWGADQAEFMFSANPGETLKPLARIISGGEMARVMLALKTILARQDLIPTLIFDEIDSGIGGATVLAVAEKMAGLSRFHQILCVTHSPQIASMADNHFLLLKEITGGRTLARARKLPPGERREELARMLDGNMGPVSMKHGETLLERAEMLKKQLMKEETFDNI